MTILTHLKELRKRLLLSILSSVIVSIATFIYYDFLISLLMTPLNSIQNTISQDNFVISSFFEGFTTKFKFSIITGILLSMPIHLFHILRFCFPGLKKTEKRFILIILCIGVLLAVLSLYLCYVYLLPFSIAFLTSINFIPENVGVLLNFNKNIFYILNFLFFSMLVFQLPLLLALLLFMNIVKRKFLWRTSRYVIVIIFVLSAVVTPPDIVSQITISLPLILLFYITLLVAKCFKWGE